MSQNATSKQSPCTELEYAALLVENRLLRSKNKHLVDYVLEKTNKLLQVMGTIVLKPEELDDATLIEFDPIGIVTESFIQILANLRKTNLKLHLAHHEIQAIFDSVGSAVLVLDPQRKIISFNENSRSKLFSGVTDFSGKSCHEIICQHHTTESRCVHSMVIASGHSEKCFGWEFGDRCFDVIGQPIKNAEDILTHVVLVYNDVTEHRRNSQALQRSLIETMEAKDQVDGLLKSMSDGLIACDAKGGVVLMNAAAEQLLNCKIELCIGQSLPDITHIPMLKNYFEMLMLGSANHSGDFELECSNGKIKTYQARSSVLSKNGNTKGYITFLQDVSREREIDRVKDEFLSTAAHQLRTPLASVIGYSELIMESESLTSATLNDYISIVYSKAEQLSEIVNNLLDISRIEAGHDLMICQAPEQVDPLIDEALAGFRKTGHKHTLEVNLKQKGVLLNVDRFAILQVLENLLSNAVNYSPDGGIIKIEGVVSDNHYQLSIIDHGLGMTDKQAVQVFDKFYRVNASNTAISGSGLGLTIVRYLVESHGGKIWIEPRPGAGITVHLTLPLYL